MLKWKSIKIQTTSIGSKCKLITIQNLQHIYLLLKVANKCSTLIWKRLEEAPCIMNNYCIDYRYGTSMVVGWVRSTFSWQLVVWQLQFAIHSLWVSRTAWWMWSRVLSKYCVVGLPYCTVTSMKSSCIGNFLVTHTTTWY